MSSDSLAVECRSLCKTFGKLKAVDNLDLEVRPGEVVGLIGPNGAGKSTTIRILLGLSIPTSGTARVLGLDPRRSLAARKKIGYAPGELRLDERFTVEQTFDLWGALRRGIDRRYRSELVDRLGVDTTKKVGSLSTGNRRKIALVGALMGRPDLLILDEPTNGLDPLVQQEFMSILGEVARDGASVLLSSHIMGEVERLADRVAVIRGGRLVVSGETHELRGRTAQEMNVRFEGAAPSAEALLATPGVVAVDTLGDSHVKITWSGAPSALLRALAPFEIVSLTAPEPDLETAFLSYYRDDAKVDVS